MAISRLLHSKPGGPNFRNGGLIESTKWSSFSYYYSCSSGKSSTSKELEAAKEGTADDKESKKESGTWFKAIVTNMKQKIFGSPPSQKFVAGKTSDSKAHMTASKVTMAQDSPCHIKFLESHCVLRMSDGTEGAVDKDAFKGAVLTATSEVGNIHNNPKNVGLDDVQIQSMAQQSEAVMDSQGNEKEKLRNFTYDEMVENPSLKMGQSGKLSDMFLEEMTNKVKQFEATMSDLHVNGDKEQSPCTEDLFGLGDKLIKEIPKTLPDSTSDFSSFEDTNHILGKRTAAFVQRTNVSTNSSKKHTSSSSFRPMDLSEIMRTKNNGTTGERAKKFHDTLVSTQVSKGKNAEEEPELHQLITHIMGFPGEKLTSKAQKRIISNVTGQLSTGGFLKNVQHRADSLDSDFKKRHTSLKQHFMSGKSKVPLDKKEESRIPTSESEENSILHSAYSDNVKSGPNSFIPLPISREELNSNSLSCFTEEESKENKLLVRFLTKNYQKCSITAAFSDCGPIVKVDEVSSANGNIFKDFLVHFETREGYKAALKRTDPVVPKTEAFVEETYLDEMESTISIPDLIGDPDAPVALVKNPTKTVKIKQLTEDISSQHLKEALAFCESGISSLFLGSSSSVVYVEFETEDAKERALAAHSIVVLGKKLPVLRIDAPRTTVVRISNIKPRINISKICNTYGQVKYVGKRANAIVDVYFNFAEWPNMLNIVNSLNGKEVEGSRWLAQPAPVFPPRVLKALWSRPEERKYVNAVMCNLLRKIEEPIHTTKWSQLTNLAAKYYGKEF